MNYLHLFAYFVLQRRYFRVKSQIKNNKIKLDGFLFPAWDYKLFLVYKKEKKGRKEKKTVKDEEILTYSNFIIPFVNN